MLRRILFGAIKQKSGVKLYSKLVVRTKYDDRVDLVRLRKLCDEKIDKLGFPSCTNDFLKRKSRVVWTKNPTVGELLHNHREFASREVVACACTGFDLPQSGGHVRCRLSELADIDPMLMNAKNVPRCVKERRERNLKKEIEDGFTMWKQGRDTSVEVELKEVKLCMNGRGQVGGELELESVLKLKRRFEGLVFTSVDRNPGETCIMCPLLYYEGMQTMFLKNEGYVFDERSEDRFWDESYDEYVEAGLGQLGKWKMTGGTGKSYVIPKHKDLGSFQPIYPTFREPMNVTSKRMARALNLLLNTLPDKEHFNLQAVSGLAERLTKANKSFGQMGTDTRILAASYDVKDMFSRLPHREIITAVDWLVNWHRERGRKVVRVNPRGKGAVFDCKTKDSWWAVSLQEIRGFVAFDLEHTVTVASGLMLRQTIGVPMGKSTSPPLACIMCAYAEWRFLDFGPSKEEGGGCTFGRRCFLVCGI
ncbi:hypothetical protein CBR_g11200 [Chara braunii]|uniref:Reverse transcriptase domain-containing protein n=1 Tax=Chara braunii TaxID=69332 RepID=A0A388KQC0_CHABU|nr:hypothetical protein CBR_g11200 [Chara braunii]|eukprot:GBG72271.1 hypothetical protein CBR_g11200 [Chara braunii]